MKTNNIIIVVDEVVITDSIDWVSTELVAVGILNLPVIVVCTQLVNFYCENMRGDTNTTMMLGAFTGRTGMKIIDALVDRGSCYKPNATIG
jgi:hypothetical protein